MISTSLPCARPEASRRLLLSRFEQWNYRPEWQKKLRGSGLYSSLLGLEFRTLDLPALAEHGEHLVRMGCNHFQWSILQPEELLGLPQDWLSELWKVPELQDWGGRESLIFAVRLPPGTGEKSLRLAERAAQTLGIGQWDRLIVAPPVLENDLPSAWLQFWQEASPRGWGVHFSPNSSARELIQAWEQQRPSGHWQVTFNLVEFKDFLRRQWKLDQAPDAFPRLLERWESGVSFRSPFGWEHSRAWQSLIVEPVQEARDYAQEVQSLQQRLVAAEVLLNQDLQVWRTTENGQIPLADFQFSAQLVPALEQLHTVEAWEEYLGGLWFPAFQHHLRSWNGWVLEPHRNRWQWHVETLLGLIQEILGSQAELLRWQQAQRMKPFVKLFEQHLPELPNILTFAAQTLWLFASTPWPETVFFPWQELDSAIEYLGLMRLPLLENAGTLLKLISQLQ